MSLRPPPPQQQQQEHTHKKNRKLIIAIERRNSQHPQIPSIVIVAAAVTMTTGSFSLFLSNYQQHRKKSMSLYIHVVYNEDVNTDENGARLPGI